MSIRRLFISCALGLAVLGLPVLSGCGDDESSDEPATVTETVSMPTSEETNTTSEDQEGGTATSSAPEAAYAVRNTGPRYFETPSSNIGCYVGPRSARCDIRERSWEPPPPEEDCELDYGQGIALGASGEASFVCAGDTALGAGKTLGYGQVSQRQGIRCRSGRKGVTCTERRSGHGFFISRDSYRIF